MKKYLTDAQLVKHIFDFEKWSKKMFKNFADHEDCVGWVTEHFIKDHSRTYSYYTAYVDYMRSKYGRNGHKIKNMVEFNENEMTLDETAEPEYDEDKQLVYEKMLKRSRNMEIVKQYASGKTMKEIGFKKAITESRICQIISTTNKESNMLYDRIKFLRLIDLKEDTKKCLIQVI